MSFELKILFRGYQYLLIDNYLFPLMFTTLLIATSSITASLLGKNSKISWLFSFLERDIQPPMVWVNVHQRDASSFMGVDPTLIKEGINVTGKMRAPKAIVNIIRD